MPGLNPEAAYTLAAELIAYCTQIANGRTKPLFQMTTCIMTGVLSNPLVGQSDWKH